MLTRGNIVTSYADDARHEPGSYARSSDNNPCEDSYAREGDGQVQHPGGHLHGQPVHRSHHEEKEHEVSQSPRTQGVRVSGFGKNSLGRYEYISCAHEA
jgi:hypothetical protein